MRCVPKNGGLRRKFSAMPGFLVGLVFGVLGAYGYYNAKPKLRPIPDTAEGAELVGRVLEAHPSLMAPDRVQMRWQSPSLVEQDYETALERFRGYGYSLTPEQAGMIRFMIVGRL